ncbi:MAG: gamma-glutamyl-gamma-aminobutyrate hydrolase family protein [Abitibacteriaceae bacterium]|nr:gamma-glutamyl-gamma-aminobutyrate hydrolase family protein [Abditibacteriaceae bacterium]
MPRIGITCSYYAWPEEEKNCLSLTRYVDAVGDAGGRGELLWLPPETENGAASNEAVQQHAQRLAQQLDGLIISGGADLPPSYYGADEHPDSHIKLVPALRPAFETILLREFLERGKPAFGICYGCQFFNVRRGGSLVQDIPTEWPNPIAHADTRHTVRVLPGTQLHHIVGMEEVDIRSSHHQSVKKLAPDAAVTSYAPDEVIEAIEFKDQPFFIGVQWHPEHDRDSLATQRLFGALIAACR